MSENDEFDPRRPRPRVDRRSLALQIAEHHKMTMERITEIMHTLPREESLTGPVAAELVLAIGELLTAHARVGTALKRLGEVEVAHYPLANEEPREQG